MAGRRDAFGVGSVPEELLWGMVRPRRARRMREVLESRTRYVTVLLEAVDDGHNQAAVLRSAEAFGVQDVSVVEGQREFAPSREITQGADKWLTIRRYAETGEAIGALRERGYTVWGSRLDRGAVPVEGVDLGRPAAFVFGNEHSGLSEEALELVDGTFVVPMCGFSQSLNISVAAAITLFHVTRRARREAGERYRLSAADREGVVRAWISAMLDRG
ncbi:TrmH family RNA methyltransferase [Rubrobacter taiwanensis]|jgi:tRNA (guanosine-2'-O-)-methyltransferase|uniref:tRNA (guanosine(18)-2'-O)-methyltransferase n=1 Tax=Rubrobacter taiwanensis TaxID=185139 RepID=A0A4R1BQR4_9ACTN|nr:RNA methyltransferase [Rubrobacter taiwanensis]TCJ19918.1 TrmH family RNA methyltransferase [Rubrobacter taiwanensis]